MKRPHRTAGRALQPLLLALLLCGGARSASAREMTIRPLQDVVGTAEVVAIARVVKATRKDHRCSSVEEIVLRPQQVLRGQLSPAMKEVLLLIVEHHGGPDCIEVSLTVPPVARTRSVGTQLIITIERVDALKAQRAIASFELAALGQIKRALSRLPAPPRVAGVAAIDPRHGEDLRWIEETLQQMERDEDFQRLVLRFGTSPSPSGSYTAVRPHSPRFASVLLIDERHAGGARTQRVTVAFAPGQRPSVSAFERRFGPARGAPPMADSRGRHVTWTRIIHLGPPRLQRGRGRVVLRLDGGPRARRVREVTVDDYLTK